MRAALFALALIACTAGPDEDDGDDTVATTDTGTSTDSGSDADSGTGTGTTSPTEYSGGDCPDLSEGLNADFLSADIDRDVRILLPDEPAGAGVVFAWHWLGGSASQILTYMDLDVLADTHGYIVVAPDSRASEAYEWDFVTPEASNADGILFDDLLACLHGQYAVDLDDIHATGMSAGGLWSTWLTVFKSDLLASTAPLSGGLSEGTYISPETPIPVLLTWGGAGDTYGGFSFDDASTYFSAQLQADGHEVIECVHDGGHTIPSGAVDYLGQFFVDHRRGADAGAYAQGLPDAFPAWCSQP